MTSLTALYAGLDDIYLVKSRFLSVSDYGGGKTPFLGVAESGVF